MLLLTFFCITAGSEGDVAGSSSEGDNHNRVSTREATGTYSPFGRLQFPRDSGCYDAALKSSRQVQHLSPQDESDVSDNITGFTDTTNNLDSIVQQCNNEILAHVRQAQKNSLNLKEDPIYQPNIPNNLSIPNSSSNEKLHRNMKESYVSVRGQTTLLDPCRKSLFNQTKGRKCNPNIEDTYEADRKLTAVKYVVGGSADLSIGECRSFVQGRGACLSEKSSDSGFSSSSVSSANPKESLQPVLCEKPILNYSNSANCTTSNTAITVPNDCSEENAL